MQLKSFFSCLFAVLLGATLAVAVKSGYNRPGVLPTTDLFMFILESPVGKFALAKRGGEGGVLISIAIRAFGYSVVIGAIAGLVLRKLRFKRAFCYSALWIPLVNALFGYLVLSSSSAEQLVTQKKEIGLMIWADLWIYGWYFLALYLSFTVANLIALRSTNPAQKAAEAG